MMSDIFNIFSIDWWMDENNNALQMTDSVLFLLLAIPVATCFFARSSRSESTGTPTRRQRTAPFPGAFHGVAQRERGD